MTLNSVARRRHFCRNNCLNAVTSEMETAVATYAVGQLLKTFTDHSGLGKLKNVGHCYQLFCYLRHGRSILQFVKVK
jgi:hypothetical protein